MLSAGLTLVFVPLRKLTLGSRPAEPQIRTALPEVQGARNDAASPDVDAAPSLPAASAPGAEMPESDAAVGVPIAPTELGDDDAESSADEADAAVVHVVDAAPQDFIDAGSFIAPVREQPVFCGPIPCPAGKVCCNPSCGICTDPGQECSHLPCLSSTTPVSIYCGPSTCNVGQVCCNLSCGICTSPGQTCDQRPCANAPEIPISFTCGMATCNVGMVCCNASCGICARPGEKCSTEICD